MFDILRNDQEKSLQASIFNELLRIYRLKLIHLASANYNIVNAGYLASNPGLLVVTILIR
ncbi:hypothetical protein [Thalassomonas actiniarum]|uniref:Uncharacterized protein n=1 Tax=Thalassomonas actiniarum TaxID=485447 RepID=A0AAE9YMN0_9GAMM|nr:hypothetical protein [Thalassomonas actiniarum]WDD97068.1 hypothetical protein SG35_017090 [Thalassomonas actiniarum]